MITGKKFFFTGNENFPEPNQVEMIVNIEMFYAFANAPFPFIRFEIDLFIIQSSEIGRNCKNILLHIFLKAIKELVCIHCFVRFQVL